MPIVRAATICAYEPCDRATSGRSERAQSLSARILARSAPALRRAPARAGPADHLRRRPALPRQLDGLCVVPRGDADVVAQLLQPAGDRLEEQRVRRVREVDPDLHGRDRLVHAAPQQYRGDRAQDQPHVVPERPVGDVEVVQLHHLLERDPGSPQHLPEAGQARSEVDPALAASPPARGARTRSAASGRPGSSRP